MGQCLQLFKKGSALGGGLAVDNVKIRDMDVESVANFLAEQGLGRFATVVSNNRIDGGKLLGLTPVRLIEMGISDTKDQTDILTLVNQLNGIVLKLTHFEDNSRGVPVVMALAAAGIPFWNNPIPPEGTPDAYSSTPTLEYIGSSSSGQATASTSESLLQFACHLADLPNGDLTPDECQLIDMVVSLARDLSGDLAKLAANPTNSTLASEIEKERLPEFGRKLESILAGSSGDALFLADRRANGSAHPPRIIIAGPPAGGKGTQCAMLKEKFGVVHLSTGDMLRAAAEAGTELGLAAKKLMDAGELVGDDVMVGLITERLKEQDCVEKGWLLDGFPRTAVQAEALARHATPDVFLQLNVPDEEIVKRVSGRRTDPVTGEIYHLEFNPPPNEEIAARLTQRSDDTEEKVIARLGKYHENINSVARVYAGKGVPVSAFMGDAAKDPSASRSNLVWEISGTEDKMEVFAAAMRAVTCLCKTTGPDGHPPRIIIAGPPAGGKGTQCAMLKEKFGVVHLSTGDMLRAAAEAGTELGLAAKKLMDAGELVGDDVIVGLVIERLKQQDCVEKGWLLDGFPRTAVQAEALARHTTPDVFLQLNVPDEEIVKRVSGRRTDPVTGEIYHLEFNPPPNEEIAARLTQRSDDTEEKVIARLGKYHENINSVARVYAGKGVPVSAFMGDAAKDPSASRSNLVWEISGTEDKMEVFAAAMRAVTCLCKTTGPDGHPPRIIIAGPPAGGKGTQCAMLKEKFGVVHLSTGDMLRAAAEAGTELGLAAKKLMDAGELVGDDVIVGLVIERLKQQDCVEKGWLLDGFPRTAVQAEALARHTTPDIFLQLNVPDEEIVKRVSGRRTDPVTGEIYHLEFNPPPNEEIAARLTQRSDDTEEKVIARLGKYHENINSVARVYGGGVSSGCGSMVWAMDGNRDKMRVFEEAAAAVEWGAFARLCAADLAVAAIHEVVSKGVGSGISASSLEEYPRVGAVAKKVLSHPRIATALLGQKKHTS